MNEVRISTWDFIIMEFTIFNGVQNYYGEVSTMDQYNGRSLWRRKVSKVLNLMVLKFLKYT